MMEEKKMKMRPLLLLSAALLAGCSVNPYRWPGAEPQPPAPVGPVTPPVVTSPEEQPPRPQPTVKPEVKPVQLIGLAQSLADVLMQDPEVHGVMQAGSVVLLLTPPRNGTTEQIDTQAMVTVMSGRIQANSPVQLVAPARVAAISSQLEYQQGSVNLASLVRLGRQAGAGYLLYGDIEAQGRQYRLTMTLMDTHSGELLWSGSRRASK